MGTVVGAGGVALGSGAFSQAEASRSVDVTVEGDGEAVVNISVLEDQSDVLSDGSTDQIEIALDDVYQDAKVLVEPALEFDNTSEDTDYDIELDSAGLIDGFTDPGADNSVNDYTSKDGFEVIAGEEDQDEKRVGIIVDTGSSDDSADDDLTITISEVDQ